MSEPEPLESETLTTTVERTDQAEPRVVYEVRDSGASTAAWWVGGLVAIVAILSVTFLVTRNPNRDQEVANAMQQGRLQGALEASQSTLASTQDAAQQAAQSAAASATLASGMTSSAAADADRSARQAAQSAQNANQAATDASARAADQSPPPVIAPSPGQPQ